MSSQKIPITKSLNTALKIQLDKFLKDENENELEFPSFLSAQERRFIHETVAKLGLKSKSRGKGVNRCVTIYKRMGSTIIQNDAKLVLDSNMRCRIVDLFDAYPITGEDKHYLSCYPEKQSSPQLAHNKPLVPNTTYNPDLYDFRDKLPVYELRQNLINAIVHNQVIIVAGSPGCGKTTQLPQLLLDYCQEQKQPARIYCTQTRAISAVSVAKRVAYERMEKTGKSIRYQTRMDFRNISCTVLTYCTIRELMRTLMSGESALTDVTYVLVDDIHERNQFTDLLLIALRDKLPRAPRLRLVLMSANTDTQIFSSYFNNCPVIKIPERLHDVQRYYLEDILKICQYKTEKMIQAERKLEDLERQKQNSDENEENVEDDRGIEVDPQLQADKDKFLEEAFTEGANGNTAYDYAVEKDHTECAKLLASFNLSEESKKKAQEDNSSDNFLLDVYHHTVSEELIDYQLMLALVKHIHTNLPEGSILVFLPGDDDIMTLQNLIQGCIEMNTLKYEMFILHNNMPSLRHLERVFSPLPDARKIIISTDIAETSMTIDDVVYVVDSCKVKEEYGSEEGARSLRCGWATRAGCRQRAARAGRARPGRCFHLCSERRSNTLPLHSIPEILRVPLQQLCLHTKLLAPNNTPIANFLSKAMDPPSFLAVRNAVTSLITIGALTPNENLTEIGQHLLNLTVEPKLGKMLLYACVMKCLNPVLTIVSSLAIKEPFQISMNPENKKISNMVRQEFAAGSYSDHMALLRAFQAWQTAKENGSEKTFCAENLICGTTMEMIVGYRALLLTELKGLGLTNTRGSGSSIRDVNMYSDKWHVVKAVLVSGLYPSIARVDSKSCALRTSKENKVVFHPSSTLYKGDGLTGFQESVKNLLTEWVIFEEISRTERFCFIKCNTSVTPLTVALFGGPLRLPSGGGLTQRVNPPGLSSDSDSEADENYSLPHTAMLTLDDWTAFQADALDAINVYDLRQKLSAHVIRRMSLPEKPLSPIDLRIVNTVVYVLGCEEKNVGLRQPTGIGRQPIF